MADFGEAVARIAVEELSALLARPEVLLIGVDDGQGLASVLGEAMLQFPRTQVALLESSPKVAEWFGNRSGMLLVLKSGVALGSVHRKEIRWEELGKLLEGAETLDVAAELAKAQAWLGELPRGDSEFRGAVSGTYREPDEYSTTELWLESSGDCTCSSGSSGIQGGSSSDRRGSWKRRDGHLLELRWTRESSDEEVGMSRHQTKKEVDWREWVRVGFKGGRGVEIRKVDGAIPSLEPSIWKPYLRTTG